MSRWLEPSELRVGLGCMRLLTEEDGEEGRALATITAAVDSGVKVFDTARSYGANEQLVARGLRAAGATGVRVVTKGGMRRAGGTWVPDGRAKAIRADCEASLDALAGLPIDLYLLHVPDPRTPWRTSVRALARLLEDGLVRRVGVANVTRAQLDEAVQIVPVAAVQVALSPFDDRALRGGVVARCEELGLTVMAHSPLGGPRRAARLRRREPFAAVAAARGCSPAEVALAWVRSLSPVVMPIVGARRPESARSAARAARLELSPAELEALAARRPAPRRTSRVERDVVLLMGIPGAGKTRLTDDYIARRYKRLNRDDRGGSLRALVASLDGALANGARCVVLDNTYLTRASRNEVIETAGAYGARVRCLWLDTPLAQAQVNMVERLLDRFGTLPTPDALREAARREQGLLAPTSQMRAARELEPPADDEGFEVVERVPFTRGPSAGKRPGVFVAAAALRGGGSTYPATEADRRAPHLVFDWLPDGAPEQLATLADRLRREFAGPVEAALCPHPGGPPVCWCRPPLPGLPLAFARAHGVDVSRSVLIGTSPAHRTLATTLGTRYVAEEGVERKRGASVARPPE